MQAVLGSKNLTSDFTIGYWRSGIEQRDTGREARPSRASSHYYLYYRVRGEQIVVLALWHTSRGTPPPV